VVPADELVTAAREVTTRLAGLDRNAHQIAKQRVRGQALTAIRAAVEAEFTS
jgi:enoyl-CoA hydratase/carnithine racemase